MIKKIRKVNICLITILLAVVCGSYFCLQYFLSPQQLKNTTRTIEVTDNAIDYSTFFEEFDDIELYIDKENQTASMTGINTLSAELFNEFDLVSVGINEGEGVPIRYSFDYDAKNNVYKLSISAETENGVIVDNWFGEIVETSNGETDILFNTDDGTVYLSELEESNIIANCGWFRRLFKKVAKAVIKVAAVVAVVAVVAIAAPVVASCVTTVATATAAIAVGGGTAAMVGTAATAALTAVGAAAVATGTTIIAASAIAQITKMSLTVSQELTLSYVTSLADDILKNNIKERYVLVVMSALDAPLITHYRPVSLETAMTWFKLGGQVWTPYSKDAEALITGCGYIPGNSKGVTYVAERNIISSGYGYFHYHALSPGSFQKIKLPGNGLDASAITSHSMHCFFYY